MINFAHFNTLSPVFIIIKLIYPSEWSIIGLECLIITLSLQPKIPHKDTITFLRLTTIYCPLVNQIILLFIRIC